MVNIRDLLADDPNYLPIKKIRDYQIIYIRLATDTPEIEILRELINTRDNPQTSGAARECLLEYAKLMRLALLDLNFTEDEAFAIVLALREMPVHHNAVHLFWASVDHYLENGSRKLNVVPSEFAERIKRLNYLHTIAIIDAARRYWYRTQRDDAIEVLVSVGLYRFDNETGA